MENLIDKAKSYIKEYFANDCSGHDYWHSIRVYNLSKMITQTEKCDNELVYLGSLLHDVDDYKLVGNQSEPYLNTKMFLRKESYPEDRIKKICNIISQVSYKGNDSVTPDTIEGKIVQDADRLDAIGAIGIARAFAFEGSRNLIIHDPNIPFKENMNAKEYYENKPTTINHFYEKLLKLKDLMNTNTAKAIAQQRHKYMEIFLKEFQNEWNGIS